MAEEIETDVPASPSDLGAGTITPQQEEAFTRQRDESLQRRRHRTVALWAGLLFTTVMVVGYIMFAAKVLRLLQKGIAFDWHVLLLGSGLIVPPTLILYVTLKNAYNNKEEKSNGIDLPSSDPLKAVADLFKSVADLIPKKGD